jgi:hypothetical protein
MRIEDQGNGTISENRRSRYELDMPIEPSQAFDDRLVVAQNLVYDETVTSTLGLGDHDLFALRAFRSNVEELSQPDIRNKFPTYFDDVFSIGFLYVLLGQFNAFQGVD